MQAAGGAHTVGARSRARSLLLLSAAVVAVDQLTKALAVARLVPGESVPALDGVLHWKLQRNPGAAFGLFARFPVVFTILAIAISAWIIATASRARDGPTAVSLGLVLGGAAGNLVDRIARPPGPFRGHVVDFIDLRVWPVFNVADSAIVVGAGLLVVSSVVADRRARRAA